jgi:PKD repeat protein
VSTGDGLVSQTDWHSGDVPSLTSLFYVNGRIYFTKAGQNTLYYRGFETEDDLVGQQRLAATSSATPAISWSQVRGAFVAGGKLFYADNLGRLFRVDFTRTGPTGAPVQVSGTGVDTQNWTSRTMFVYPNAAPTASFTLSCNGPTCKVDATGSADPDGSIASYDWSWGDGTAHDSGATATHTYAAGGSDDVTLTVTDNRGSTGTVTHTATPTSTGSQISYVGASSAAAGSTNATTPAKVTVPAGVQAGDELVLILSAAATQQAYNPPAGWTLVANPTSSSLSERVWVRPATASDAGTTVGVTTGASTAIKTNLSILAYRGVDTANPVSASASQADNTAATSHTSPTVQAPDGTGWLLSYWAEKSSSTTGATWTDAGGQTQRTGTGSTATGSGHVDSVVGDSNGAVDAGTRGGYTATSGVSAQALSLTLVLKSL